VYVTTESTLTYRKLKYSFIVQHKLHGNTTKQTLTNRNVIKVTIKIILCCVIVEVIYSSSLEIVQRPYLKYDLTLAFDNKRYNEIEIVS